MLFIESLGKKEGFELNGVVLNNDNTKNGDYCVEFYDNFVFEWVLP